ncbi:MAG: ATP-dependent DNA helicase [Vicinamibacterales bacterium]
MPPSVVQLSAEQQAVVSHRGADLQVIACAGSGKTESIAQRVAALINEGAEPASIVAFTFTERAALELKERIVRRVADLKGPEFRDRLGPMFVGTIHAYCFRLLQDYVPKYGNYDVLDENRHAGFLSREFYRLGLSKLKAKHWAPIRDFAQTVDVIANEFIPANALAGTPLGECYAAYRESLTRHHCLTFSLIITSALEALEEPAIRDRVLAPLRYLLVDEYQDINPAQERLIELLSPPPVQLTVVGDDDQSIYQWRGSDVRNILTFKQRRAGAVSVDLDTNRRSRKAIVERASTFASTIPNRLPKTMKAHRPEGTSQVVPWTAATDVSEAETIADTIQRLKDERGFQYRDVAVLFRSVRTSAQPLIAALRARDIPYTAGGRTGLFMQPEVAYIAEIYAWFVDGKWRDESYGEFRDADLTRIILGLNTVFGNGKPIPHLKEYLEDWRAFALQGSRPVNLVGDYYRLLHLLGAHQTDLSQPAGSARMGALGRFSEVLADFEHVNRRGRQVEQDGELTFEAANDRGRNYFRALHNYLLHYARDAYEEFEGEPSIDLDAVDILTVHQAKGLEWPVVFLPSLTQGRFPSRRAGQAQDWLLPESVFAKAVRQRYEGGDEEERRLFYVAMTRARDTLYASCFERKTNKFKPSDYFVELAGKVPPVTNDLPLPDAVGKGGPEKEQPTLDVSFSDLASFEECGFRYRLSNVLGFQTQIAPELGYGRAVHHVLRQLAETVRDTGEIPERADLQRLADEEFFVPFASFPGWQSMRKAARRLVTTYVAEYADDLHRVWAVERPFALHLDDGVVSGRADVILDGEDGRAGSLAIVDYKVSSDAERAARYEEQLQVYAVAGRGEGLTVHSAYLHELKDGSRSSVNISPAATAAALTNLTQRLGRLRAAEYVPAPKDERCKGCEYNRICQHASCAPAGD